PKGYRTVKKISSPICDAIICNNKSNHFISIQLFLTNTLKLTTLPVLRVGGRLALGTYRCPLAKTCKHVLCFPNTVWQAWLRATVPPAPFVKPHCVLIVAAATVLLIKRRSAHTDVRSQKHASMFCASRTLYG
uniref:hypothetical protein n=1 Tax=[Ruminococcus] torques TaxID=33039 RepID=UPI003AB5013B